VPGRDGRERPTRCAGHYAGYQLAGEDKNAFPIPKYNRCRQLLAKAVVEMFETNPGWQRHYTFDSFRAGSALTGFLAGVPLLTIMTQGCWDDYPTLLAYLRIPAAERLEQLESALFRQQQFAIAAAMPRERPVNPMRQADKLICTQFTIATADPSDEPILAPMQLPGKGPEEVIEKDDGTEVAVLTPAERGAYFTGWERTARSCLRQCAR
jgi:hypothetical protein